MGKAVAKDADAVVPIASLAKLVTAMVVLDARLDPHETLRIAREEFDFASEQFMQWFIKEQVEEVAPVEEPPVEEAIYE
mgnify:CR=1 FL=1